MKVLRVSARDTYQLRHKMLRPHGTLADCVFKNDDDDLTFHLGAFIDGKLVSVASFYFENKKSFEAQHPHQYRLRGMATLPEFQGQGLSSALLKTAFPLIKGNQCTLLWCYARESAEGFYKKVGFVPHGELFEVPVIGPHRLMSIEIR
ncbi:MAG: GNAT family N-acetyltransferase [Bacteriovoracia bacterium]